MASNTESGHAVNNANYKLMADTCAGYGVKYKPSNTKLTVAEMLLLWTLCKDANTVVSEKLQEMKEPINARQILFNPMDKLVTRVQGMLESTQASEQAKADGKGHADKIRGYGKPKAKTNPDGTPTEETVSQSQQSFVQKAQHFGDYIAFLNTVTKYVPNEDDLKTTALTTYHESLVAANEGMGLILQPFNQALIARNHNMYDEGGMVDLALQCKEYVKAVFEAKSPEYKLVSKIKFTRPKKKK